MSEEPREKWSSVSEILSSLAISVTLTMKKGIRLLFSTELGHTHPIGLTDNRGTAVSVSRSVRDAHDGGRD